MSLMRALSHPLTAQRRRTSAHREAHTALVPRSRTSRAVVLVVAALGLALATPNAYAMDEPFDGAIPMTQTQSRLTSNESTLPSLARSEEHTSELQSLMRISYAVFCLKKKSTQLQTEYTM